MARLKRLKTMLSTTAAHIAPMQGEYLGGAIPHLLLVGRRGQPFWWSPSENNAGNHNIAICGKWGSGKSVLLPQLCAASRGAGAKVEVIDDGRSFEHSVKLQGGERNIGGAGKSGAALVRHGGRRTFQKKHNNI